MKKKRTQSKGVLSYKKKRTKSKKKVSSYQKKRTKSKHKVSSQRKRTKTKPRRKRTLRKSKGGAQSDDDYAFLVDLDQQYQSPTQVEPEVVQSEEEDGEELDIGDIRIGLDEDDEEERGEEEEEVPRRGQYFDDQARNKATAKRGWSKVRSSVEQGESALAEAKILEEQERKTDDFVESLGAELPNRPYVDPDQEEERIERARERARERHQQSLRERDERIKDEEDRQKRDLAKKRWKGAIGSHVEAIGIEKERERERGLDLDRIEEQERKTDEFVESLGAELPSSEYVPPVPDLPNIPYVEPGQGESQPSTWSKFKNRFQGEEYEAFINRTGTELKELYLEYLTEYFKDIEEAAELDVLKGKYMSFIEKYYEIAIKNDKKLIDMLK